MKQVLVKGGSVRIEEVPAPCVGAGRVLVRVRRSLISSGTESGFVSEGGLAGFVMKKARDPLNVEKVKRKLASVGVRGTWEVVRSKLFEFQAPGYSTSGEVVGVGEGVPGLRVGDRVACSGVGYAAHAEYNLVPHALVTPVPEGVDFDEAAFVTLGAIAMQGVRQAQPTFGETVVVIGLGLLGQLAAQIVRTAGCHVIGCDPVESRRALALELGAEAACDPESLDAVVREWSGGYGADAAIVCAASKESVVTNQALDVCRHKGRVAVVGAVGLGLERESLYMKELDFRLSCSYGPGRYQPAYEERGLDYPIGYVRWTEGRNMAEFLRMTASGRVRVRPLIGAVHGVDAAQAAYDAVLQGGAIAALIDYGSDAPAAPPAAYSLQRRSAVRAGGVGVAVIGAGSFASAHHLPNLARMAGVRLEAVVNRTGGKAKQAADRFGARYCTTDYREALADPKVDAVAICTRHNLHAAMCIAAAEAGKHVFVEKPMGMTVAECEAIAAAAARAGVLLSVGFNRRYSALSLALYAALGKTPGPRQIVYRVNAGALPANHWAADAEEGGGRIVGEGVHFFDWCCWLIGGDPVAVRAERIGAPGAGAAADDNLSANLRFADGSLATVVYTALGHANAGKERIEVFAGGGTAVLDDYRSLSFHGLPGANVRGKEDKGQYACLERFVQAVQGKAELGVTAADGLRATRIALEALASARGGA